MMLGSIICFQHSEGLVIQELQWQKVVGQR